MTITTHNSPNDNPGRLEADRDRALAPLELENYATDLRDSINRAIDELVAAQDYLEDAVEHIQKSGRIIKRAEELANIVQDLALKKRDEEWAKDRDEDREPPEQEWAPNKVEQDYQRASEQKYGTWRDE